MEGVVQGVGFRYHARREAQRLGLCGWVKNLSDGSVLIEAEGESPALELFLGWCREGPRMARVRHVELDRTSQLENYDGFDVRF